MKVTILGAGVGASHYLPGKNINQYPPAFLIEWGTDEKILFDCSQAVDQRLEKMGTDYASIHHVAISHPHVDHCAPIHFLQSVFLKGLWGGEKFKNNELTFYGPDFLIDNFQALFDIQTPNNEGEMYEWPKVSLVPMSTTHDKKKVFSATLEARKVHHGFGKCDAVSYRLEAPEGVVVYSGDTGDCDGVREMAKNADLFICEASASIGDFDAAKNYGHLNPETVGNIAKAGNVKKVILFHYTGLDDDEAMIADVKKSGYNGEVIAGKDLQVITL